MKTLQVELPDEIYERAERHAVGRGKTLLGEVGDLVRMLGDDVVSHGRSVRERLHTIEELAKLAEECSDANWDAQGAAAVDLKTLEHAQRLVEALPGELSDPSIGVEADGHLTLEWYRDSNHVVSVSVSPDSDLFYAALFGNSDIRGRERFRETVPEIVLGSIRRVDEAFPHQNDHAVVC